MEKRGNALTHSRAVKISTFQEGCMVSVGGDFRPIIHSTTQESSCCVKGGWFLLAIALTRILSGRAAVTHGLARAESPWCEGIPFLPFGHGVAKGLEAIVPPGTVSAGIDVGEL